MSHSNHSLHITKICIASVAIASFLGLKLKSIEYRKRRTKFAAWLLVTVSAIEISDFIVLLLLRGPTSTQNFVSTGLYTVSNLLQIDHLLFASDPAWHACLVSWFAMAIYNLLGIIDSTTGSSTLTTYLICGLVSASCQLFLNLTLFGAFLLDNGGRILLDNNVENTSTEPADDLSPKKVVEDIREAGGIWAWLKKFAIFKDWILPTNVRETILCCFVFTFILATVLLNLYAPYVVGGFIDKLAQMRRIRDSRYLSKTTAYVALVDAARIILPQVKRYLFFRFNNVRLARAKSRIFSFFMNHEASFFDRLDPTTATRSINLGLEVVTALDKLVLDLVPQVMQLTGALAAMISLYGFNPTLMVLFEAALSAIISLRKEKEMVKFHDDYRETSNQAERFRQNGLRGWKTVKQCGQEVREINKYTETVGKSRDQSQTISNINYSLYSLFMTLSIGCGWSSLYLVSESAVHGRVTVGSITTFFWYVGLVRGPLSYFEDVWGDLFHSFCEANQMRRLLEQKPKMKDGKNSIRNPHGNIRFVNVTFSYSKGDNDKTKVLQNFNMMVPARKMTALVGESGIGKTTMCDLGYRMHDLDGGTITIDDQDITTTKVEELRGSITYMPQEAHIFYDTIEGNIRYAKPDATSEEVRDAAKRAGLGDLEERGKGYAELVGAEGNQLSGGQKQRVALARALVRKPPIVMLDEPTSALDGETEAHVMRSIRENFRESTILLNAHRLSSVKEADHIIVLGKREDGFPEVVETGTHNELCALGGKYAKLWEKSIGKTIEMSVEDLL